MKIAFMYYIIIVGSISIKPRILKKSIFSLVFSLALILAVAFVFTTCMEPASEEAEKFLTGEVYINGNAVIGQTLSANTVALNGNGAISYLWQKNTNTENIYTWRDIGNDSTYIIDDSDKDQYIRLTVYRAGYSGSVTSHPTPKVRAPVPPAEPLTGTVSIIGDAIVGQTLGRNIDNLEGSGNISYQWEYADTEDGPWTDIFNATGLGYSPAIGDFEKYIRLTVSRAGNSGSISSEPIGPVSMLPLTGTVRVVGTVEAGRRLNVTGSNIGGSGTISYQWERAAAADADVWEAIGENQSSYVLITDDFEKYIRVSLSRTNNSGSITSDAAGPVTKSPLTGTVNVYKSGNSSYLYAYTANLSYLEEPGEITCLWERAETQTSPWTAVSEIENDGTCPITVTDIGKYYRVTVSRANNTGSVTSSAFQVTGTTNIAGTVSVIGTFATGETVRAVVNDLNVSGTLKYRWERNPQNAWWETIIGANEETYTLTMEDADGWVRVIVECVGYPGWLNSIPNYFEDRIIATPLTGQVYMNKENQTVYVGETLTSDIRDLGGSGAISYQWQMLRDGYNWADISGANSSSYTLVNDDVNRSIRVSVSRANNSGRVYSNSSYVSYLPLTGTVSISGNAYVGAVLTADTSNLGGTGAIIYQWQRASSPDSNQTPNIGSGGASYTPVNNDFNYVIRVTVRRANYTGTINSEWTSPVILPPLTGTVSISGNPYYNNTLTATANLDGSGAATYRWERADTQTGPSWTTIGGNSTTYTPVVADTGKYIRVTVQRTQTNSGSLSSEAVLITYASLTGTVSISGEAIVGSTLTANTGSLGGSGPISYQWERGNSQTGPWTEVGSNSTYTPVAEDTGYVIRVRVTRSYNSGSITSEATAAVVKLPLTGTVSITGNLRVSQTLTANTSSLGGSGPISYQWERGSSQTGPWTGIGSNAATFTPSNGSFLENYIRVTVTRLDNVGSVSSAAAGPIGNPSLSGSVSLPLGSQYVGQTVTVNINSLSGTTTDPYISGVINYQWLRYDGSNWIDVGTNSDTYLFTLDDIGKNIRVRVTREGYDGSVLSSNYCTGRGPTLTGTVSINNAVDVGAVLTVVTDGLEGSGDISYQWQISNPTTGTWSDIGTNSPANTTYTISSYNAGYYIRVAVSRAYNSGSVYSNEVGPIAGLTGSVSISGYLLVGNSYTGTYYAEAVTTNLGGSGTISYQWQRGDTATGPWTTVGSNSSRYNITSEDLRKYIRVTVTRQGYSGSITSIAYGPVAYPQLTGTVSISGTPRNGYTLSPSSNLGGTGTISYRWERASSANASTWTLVSNYTTYPLVASDVGYYIRVTATRAGYDGEISSSAVQITQ
jgi:hypothetical protein